MIGPEETDLVNEPQIIFGDANNMRTTGENVISLQPTR
jgi:hypothetical protein